MAYLVRADDPPCDRERASAFSSRTTAMRFFRHVQWNGTTRLALGSATRTRRRRPWGQRYAERRVESTRPLLGEPPPTLRPELFAGECSFAGRAVRKSLLDLEASDSCCLDDAERETFILRMGAPPSCI